MLEQLTTEEANEIYVASGFAHPGLSGDIATAIGCELGPVTHTTFPNAEVSVRFEESVRGKRVFLIQSHASTPNSSVNDAIWEQGMMIDAARSSSASEITVVSPFMAYMRQDRKNRGRIPIGARFLIDALASAGANRFVTVDMHSAQSQAIFRGPFDHLTAQPLLRQAMLEEAADYPLADCVVVAPDSGAVKSAERHRREIGVGVLHMAKMRDADDSQKIHRDEKIPEAEGRICLLFDDMVDTAGTLTTAAEALKNSGAVLVLAAATHGLFSDPAIERLKRSPIDKLIVTNTVPTETAQYELGSKLRVVSVAPMVGRALLEVFRHGSVSQIFDDENYM